MGVSKNAWFIMENPSINRSFGGADISGNHPVDKHGYMKKDCSSRCLGRFKESVKLGREIVISVGTAHVLQRTSSCVAQIQIYVQFFLHNHNMFSILDESPLDIPTIPPI